MLPRAADVVVEVGRSEGSPITADVAPQLPENTHPRCVAEDLAKSSAGGLEEHSPR